MKVVAMLKKINPELVIILGGPEVTYDVGEWLDQIPGADFIVIGEGEVTFKALYLKLKVRMTIRRSAALRIDRMEKNHPASERQG